MDDSRNGYGDRFRFFRLKRFFDNKCGELSQQLAVIGSGERGPRTEVYGLDVYEPGQIGFYDQLIFLLAGGKAHRARECGELTPSEGLLWLIKTNLS